SIAHGKQSLSHIFRASQSFSEILSPKGRRHTGSGRKAGDTPVIAGGVNFVGQCIVETHGLCPSAIVTGVRHRIAELPHKPSAESVGARNIHALTRVIPPHLRE